MRLSAPLVGAFAAALGLAGPALADPPTRETVQLVRQVPVFHTCAGFAVRAEFRLIRELTTFTDAEGTPVRRLIRATIDGTLRNSVSGASLESTGVRVFHIDLLTGETATTGSNTIIRRPNGGTITLGTGRLEFDAAGQLVDYSGPTDDGEFADLCEALS